LFVDRDKELKKKIEGNSRLYPDFPDKARGRNLIGGGENGYEKAQQGLFRK
jgi:hypothetical protein